MRPLRHQSEPLGIVGEAWFPDGPDESAPGPSRDGEPPHRTRLRLSTSAPRTQPTTGARNCRAVLLGGRRDHDSPARRYSTSEPATATLRLAPRPIIGISTTSS